MAENPTSTASIDPSPTAFSTWRALYEQLKNDLASKSFRTMQSYTLTAGGAGGARTVTYRNLADLTRLMELAKEEMAAEEYGPFAGRTYASNGGRG